MGIESDILEISGGGGNIESYGTNIVPNTLQRVTFQRVNHVMTALGHASIRINRVVFSLLDNERPSWYRAARENQLRFSDGAQQAHISCHVGILQEENPDQKRKLDREMMRDEYISPLIGLGIIERVFHYSGEILAGHPIANSSSNCYRLTQEFVLLLQTESEYLQDAIQNWANQDDERVRALAAAQALAGSVQRVGTPHENLIRDAAEIYVPWFLPGFEIVLIDCGSGTRITPEESAILENAGLGFERGDAFPDILLWNSESDELWVVEAVVSDGEVDLHKVQRMQNYCDRYEKPRISFTTAYENWSTCGRRQNQQRNIYPNTFLWIRDDPAKQFLCETGNMGGEE
jgi:hypothetical protein